MRVYANEFGGGVDKVAAQNEGSVAPHESDGQMVEQVFSLEF